MSRQRKVKSVKDELVKKSREAILAAVQIYNSPQITFKAESFITLSIIGWTYLLHAYYRKEKVCYRYYSYEGKRKIFDKTKHGAYKHWELERCINDKKCPLDADTISNLRFLIGVRHEIEHQMTDRIDEFISAKLQACAINFDYYITMLFGEKYSLGKELALAIQFSPLTPEQRDSLQDNSHITTNVRNFVVDFENRLPDDSLKNPRYAYRVLFVPINAKREGQADQVVEFLRSDSPLAQDLDKYYTVFKETEKPKYLAKIIVGMMHKKGYVKFTVNKHTALWKMKDAKNPKRAYGTQIASTWYWYDKWVQEVENYCGQHEQELK